jgi:hypothetical protein
MWHPDKMFSQVSSLFAGRSAVLLGGALALSGCGRNDVQVYQVSRQEPAAPPQTMPAGHPNVATAMPRLKWTLPAGWEEQTPGEMRVASFRVKGQGTNQADVSVIPLPGAAGGDLNNVNRWRSQVSVPPVAEPELAKLAEKVQIAGSDASLYDQAGVNPAEGGRSRILAAILHREGMAWFFKMTGDDDLVAQQKPAFVEFLKSLRFEVAEAEPALPPSHPPIGLSLLTTSTSAPAKPDWTVPPSWKEEPPTQMLLARFSAADNDAHAEITVSVFPGDVGGQLANVNRWRSQVGLEPVVEADLAKLATPVDIADGKAMFVDMIGTDAKSGQPARLLGAMVPQAGQTWFYKMLGDGRVVEREKGAFTKFVQTVKYSHAP